jgi:hypothetical protein
MACFCRKECLILLWDHLLPQDIHTGKNSGEPSYTVQENLLSLAHPKLSYYYYYYTNIIGHGLVIPLGQRVKPGPSYPASSPDR